MSHLLLWQQCTLDALLEHRATKQPLNLITGRIGRLRHLGSQDRKLMQDSVFQFVRLYQHEIDSLASKQPAGLVVPYHQRLRLALESIWQEETPQETAHFPDWFTKHIQAAYTQNAPALLDALAGRALPVLAIDRTQTSLNEVCQSLDTIGIQYTISPVYKDAICIQSTDFKITKLPATLLKSIWLMDDASQLAASLVAAKPGETVLDMCAGGGGKSRFILQTGAHVVAADKSLARLKAALARPGMKSVQPVVADSLQPPFVPVSFDWVVLDAPCSGTGVLRREADKLTRLQESDIETYAALQRGLIQSASNLVKPKGHLLYFTCSILPQENDAVVENFLSVHPSFQLISRRLLLPSKEGCDGFFIAHLQQA